MWRRMATRKRDDESKGRCSMNGTFWKSMGAFVGVMAAIFTLYLVADSHWARAADVKERLDTVDKRFDGIQKTLKEGQLDILADKQHELEKSMKKSKSKGLDDEDAEARLLQLKKRIKRLEDDLKPPTP